MKQAKKWRYYCEYCKKSGASSGHMKRHEQACTCNPTRVCKMCAAAGEIQPEITILFNVLKSQKSPFDDKRVLDDLREAAHGCPACMLAALRQYKKNDIPMINLIKGFNYEQEKEDFWADININAMIESQQAEYDAINKGES